MSSRPIVSTRAASIAAILGAALLVGRPVGLAQEAASKKWVRTGGPPGGIGYDIRVRPDNPNIMYVTDGLAGVHKSTNGGRTWTSINQGIDARTGPSNDHIPAFCLTIDPNNFNVLWVGMQEVRGVYRSGDGGKHWEKRITGIIEPDGVTVRGITVQRGDSNVVYAAGEISSFRWAGKERKGKEFDMVKGVVYKSTDAGRTWRAIWRGDNLARYVIIDPTNPKTVYVSTGIFDREAANSDPQSDRAGGVGLLKSTDGGASWRTINNGLENLYVGSIFMHPTDPKRLLAGTGNVSYPERGGAYLTTDGGDTWQYMTGSRITAVEFSTQEPDVAYAAGDHDFYRSADRGETWEPYLNRNGESWGPDGVLVGFPIDVQLDPRNSRRLFVNNYGGGNFLTTDGGASWGNASDGYTGADVRDIAVSAENPALIFANAKSGPFKSTNSGRNWQGINPVGAGGDLAPISEGARVAIDPTDSDHVLVSSAHQGLAYESLDGGRTWRIVIDFRDELLNLPVKTVVRFQQGVQAFAFAPSWRLKVYAGFGYQACVLHVEDCQAPTLIAVTTSEDGGRTWTVAMDTGFDTSTVPAIAVHPRDPNTAWAGTMGKGVFKTANGGSRWSKVSTGLTDLNIESLVVDPTRPEILYAGTVSKGVYKSTDGGVTWKASSTGMKNTERINAVAVDPKKPTTVYAGSYESGVYMSTNGGTSWTLMNTGLRRRSIRSLAISSDGKLLYAGTFGEGVFRLGK